MQIFGQAVLRNQASVTRLGSSVQGTQAVPPWNSVPTQHLAEGCVSSQGYPAVGFPDESHRQPCPRAPY
jgi:hypothetical protein